ncbi:hypothetical protein BSK64_06370 [Paenibacillus odorifer]|uniref:hypothetical protein n=1 Tax=Paenibacillus odorifer TaxID=189426 RepID=UPI00096CA752|nr:hypothetical protein [Paenibacillus odorifer]OME07876.1 hypothetical protein BSK64_06370 [Paenibacillus odorifer]
MSDYINKIQSHEYILNTYELVKEWEIWVDHHHIGPQKITIKIHEGNDGRYHYTTSHMYQGTQQAGPYLSSDSSATTIESAVDKAIRQLFAFFNIDDEGARWVEAK